MEFKEIVSLFLSIYVVKSLKLPFPGKTPHSVSGQNQLVTYDNFGSDVMENQGDNKKKFIERKRQIYIRPGLGIGFAAVSFYPLFNFTQKKITSFIPQNNALVVVGSSLVINFTSTYLLTPIEVIESYFRSKSIELGKLGQKAGGVIKTTSEIIKNHGIKKLWAGASFCGVKVAGYLSGLTTIQPKVEEHLVKKGIVTDDKIIVPHLISGAITGGVITCITHPFDTVSSFRYSNNFHIFKNNLDVIKSLYRSKGIRGFATGFPLRLRSSIIEITVITALMKIYNRIKRIKN